MVIVRAKKLRQNGNQVRQIKPTDAYLDAYYLCRLTPSEIAAKYNVAYQTVTKTLARFDPDAFQMEQSRRRLLHKRKLDLEKCVAGFYRQGLSVREIARRCGVSHQAVLKVLLKLDRERYRTELKRRRDASALRRRSYVVVRDRSRCRRVPGRLNVHQTPQSCLMRFLLEVQDPVAFVARGGYLTDCFRALQVVDLDPRVGGEILALAARLYEPFVFRLYERELEMEHRVLGFLKAPSAPKIRRPKNRKKPVPQKLVVGNAELVSVWAASNYVHELPVWDPEPWCEEVEEVDVLPGGKRNVVRKTIWRDGRWVKPERYRPIRKQAGLVTWTVPASMPEACSGGYRKGPSGGRQNPEKARNLSGVAGDLKK